MADETPLSPSMILTAYIPPERWKAGAQLYITVRYTWLDHREEYYASLASYWQERFDGLCTNGSTAWYEGREETT